MKDDKKKFIDNLIRKANKKKREGKIDDAIADYRQAIELSNNSYIIHHNLGDALLKKELLEEAAYYFKKAVELNPSSVISCGFLGEILLKQKLFDQAILYLEKAIDKYPQSHKYYNDLGLALIGQGNNELATNYFQKAIELNPNSCWGYYYLSQALLQQNKSSSANEYYRKAIKLNPQLDKQDKKSNNNGEIEFTGERYLPKIKGQIRYEHLHRYGLCLDIVEGKSVLDIASGEGYGSAILSRTANSVIGIDIDMEVVKIAENKYKDKSNLKFLVGQCDSIPLPDKSIDVVVSFETIEHHDKHEEMMQEIKRVLRKNGLLVISSPNRLVYSDMANYNNPFHVKELYEEEFVNLLNKYFQYSALYGQKISMGSFVYALKDSNKYQITNYTSNEEEVFKKNFFLNDSVYFIALCSDSSNQLQYNLDSVYLDDNDNLDMNLSLEYSFPKINNLKINTTIISCLQNDREALWGFNIDCVQQVKVNRTNGVEILLRGWVLGKKYIVEAIEIIYNHVAIQSLSVNLARPDVALAYPHVPNAEISGFETIVNIGELLNQGELIIQAVFSDKSIVQLKKVQFQVLT